MKNPQQSLKNFSIVAMTSLLFACQLQPTNDRANQASFKIAQLSQLDYDMLYLEVIKDEEAEPIIGKSYGKDQSEIQEMIVPGSYTFDLEYRKGQEIVASSQYCSEEFQKSRSQTIVEGENSVDIFVCLETGIPVETTVTIRPVLVDGQELVPDAVQGKAQFQQFSCQSCHGEKGVGGSFGDIVGDNCASCSSKDSLIAKIAIDMPPNANSSECGQQCAINIIEYLGVNFE